MSDPSLLALMLVHIATIEAGDSDKERARTERAFTDRYRRAGQEEQGRYHHLFALFNGSAYGAST